MGDFNNILSSEEKLEGRPREKKSFQDFKQLIDDNQLLDVRYNRKPWTWCNNWKGSGEIMQRLDRGLCSEGWPQLFENAKCSHNESHASDHNMLLLETLPVDMRKKKRFYFDKRWVQHEGA
ncbi:uncharacterized protein [Coffea arabica]|uniref:Uncharacterized protein n=1 Tax=Coffea arabica TaxID=13443 RepID=A0ABM4VMC6_COFAR